MHLFTTSLQAFVATVFFIPMAYAGKTQTISNWGDNPSGLPATLLYTPDKIAEKPAVVLGVSTLRPPHNDKSNLEGSYIHVEARVKCISK